MAAAFTAEEIQRIRTETKGTRSKIHFNNAGSSLPPDVVVDTVVNFLKAEAVTGGYEAEYNYRESLDNTYTSIARLINAQREEIAVVENASIAWGLAFNGILFSPGDEIITSELEYVTNVLGFQHVVRDHGVVIRLIPNDVRGNFSLPQFEKAISSKTRLIAVTHIGSSTGGVLPAEEIGAIARKHNVLYLLDACQSAGQMPLDVKAIGCDMLSVTGRKYLRAPRGTGFLFVRRSLQDKLRQQFTDGFSTQWVTETEYKLRDDARRFELYEKSRALTLGLGAAVDYAMKIGVDRIWQRVHRLGELLRAKLLEIEGVSVHDTGDMKSGIVTFAVAGKDSGKLKDELIKKDINVSVGLPRSTLYYMNKHGLTSVVRASVHYYNTEEEITRFCEVLQVPLSQQGADSHDHEPTK